jgi:hypothetical protein
MLVLSAALDHPETGMGLLFSFIVAVFIDLKETSSVLRCVP